MIIVQSNLLVGRVVMRGHNTDHEIYTKICTGNSQRRPYCQEHTVGGKGDNDFQGVSPFKLIMYGHAKGE